ncbi:TPA: hypothetical protein MH565_27950 [Klebsiella pneumoniae]|uniref:Uncharacterized protein n=2 Tax=Klebsiella pneumoniae TaxID=573 RepID=A0A9Q7GBR9_KLEPN|nr:hypothetical protein BB788_27220 [Klebsiella pneumoniae]ARV43160.1 hypothetical protein RJA_28860 [Klebsiella pneumoniae subsp. pneumoniae]RHX51482.1 hypothetical protein D3O91_25685 [Escherichia coli]TYC68315.1 hypothetical protein E4M18_027030 [Klebsiella sp. Z2]AUN60079.1 hypothetical protein C0076_27880 [Klebsiella pneumoniae]
MIRCETFANSRCSLTRYNHTQISHIAGDLSMNTSPWNPHFFRRIREPLRQLHMQFPADDRL